MAREFFLAEHGREPIDARELAGQIAKDSRPRTQTVAGYDLTFSPVKSVSTLWAVAEPAVAAVIERAHQAAVKDALAFIEKHALFTRTGPQGIRQVNVRGLVATAFTHRDSRAGDPDLHTHVAVANKVQTLDGRWLSIDGRVLFKANVAASETYNTALEQHLRDSLGVRFAERPGTDPAKRPIREIVGVDPRLNKRWSTRRAHIDTRRGELAIQFQHDHGRPPTPVEALHLAQQATLETRDAKHEPRSLAEQRATWLNEAAAVLGGSRGRRLDGADGAGAARRGPSDRRRRTGSPRPPATSWPSWRRAARPGRCGMSGPKRNDRSAPPTCPPNMPRRWWTCWSMRCSIAGLLSLAAPRSTASRSRRRYGGSTAHRSTPSPAPTSTPRSGSSTPRPASSPRPDDATGQPSTQTAVDLALLEMAANGTALDAGQAALVRQMCTSGARLQLAIAPAGAGKTTAMRALTLAWTQDGGQVLGLAPSAAAAAVLAEQTGIRTDTLAKLTWSLQHGNLPDWAARSARRHW